MGTLILENRICSMLQRMLRRRCLVVCALAMNVAWRAGAAMCCYSVPGSSKDTAMGLIGE